MSAWQAGRPRGGGSQFVITSRQGRARRAGPALLFGLLALLGMTFGHATAGDLLDSESTAFARETRESENVEDLRIRHLLRRTTFGPLPTDLEEVKRLGIEAWLDRQLAPELIPDPEVEKRLEKFETVKLTGADILRMIRDSRTEMAGPPTAGEDRVEAARRRLAEVNRLRNLAGNEIPQAVLIRAAYSQRQLHEVMLEFWRNHFNVDISKGNVQYYIADWEKNVLRPNVFGKFEDFLMATAKHPAMLYYLDNHVSRAPQARGERVRRGDDENRIAGLNENYARELMELHTVGVDNGYKLDDVIALALVLTGWTIDNETGVFEFRDNWHARGKKRVMGKTVKEAGVEEGEKIVKYLANHKNTANFIVTKMARYLVNDEPDAALIADVSKVWKKSKGDLKAVTKAILTHETFFSPENVKKKAKTPFEYVTSTLRVTGADIQDGRGLLGRLADMQQAVYRCEDPTGYSDRSDDWMDPGVLAVRWQLAYDLLHNRLPGVRVTKSHLFDQLRQNPQVWEFLMVEAVFANEKPGTLTLAPFRKRVKSVRRKYRKMRPDELKQEFNILVTLLLGSPEFQRQ